MTERARTVFLGSGSFAVPIVGALAGHPSVDLVAVVTAPTRRGSRGRSTDPPVAEWAADRELPMLRPLRLRDDEAIDEIRSLHPGLLVLADYGQIVPATLIDLPSHGALNLHPSLLPRHRGAAPIPAAILAGDDETGVTLMVMDAGIDTGPIVAQRKRPLTGLDAAPELESDLARAAAELLGESLAAWLDGRLAATAQPSEGLSLTRTLRREDGRLDPGRSAEILERQVRAYQPWPGSFVETADGRVIVWRSAVVPDLVEPAGLVVGLHDGGLGLSTANGVLELLEVQPAGGRRMSGVELVRGRPSLIGAQVVLPDPTEARSAGSA